MKKPVLFGLIGLGIALLVAVVVIVALVIPRQSSTAALSTPAPTATASPTATPTPSTTPTAKPKPTPTPTPAPVVAAPAPVAPAPAPVEPAPAPVAPAPVTPVLPPPPAPVIPPLSIDSMSASTTSCTGNTWFTVSWSTTGALENSATMRIRSGGGTPLFDQLWTNLPVTNSKTFWLDCTRPIWFFALSVSDGTTTKTALLTVANGVDKGWSSH